MGTFASCTNSSITTHAECYETRPEFLLQMELAGHPQHPESEREWFQRHPTATSHAAPENIARFGRRSLFEPALPALEASAPPLITSSSSINYSGNATDVEEEDDDDLESAEEALAAARRRARRRQLSTTRHQIPSPPRGRHGRRLKGGGGGDDGDDLSIPVAWLNPSFGSFDDFPSAMLILYARKAQNT